MNDIEYPIRINRYLYLEQYCSRRQADRFIEKGQVLINGKKAVLGQKVNKEDKVEVKGAVKKAKENFLYFIFNKTKGIVTTNPQRDEQGIEDVFKPASMNQPPNLRVSPVGRLDKDSHGLVFLTNDGRIVNPLLSPDFNHEKEYIVRLNKDIKPSLKNKMEKGIDIEGYVTKPAKVRIMDTRRFRIILTEGKKHQIRRMATALGYEVTDLKRTRMMNIKLGNLEKGTGRELTKKEASELLKSLGIKG